MTESSVVGKVYILTSGDYSSYSIQRVFISKEKAQKYLYKLAEKQRYEDIENLEKAKQDMAHYSDPDYITTLSPYDKDLNEVRIKTNQDYIQTLWGNIQNNSKDSRTIGETMMINSYYLEDYRIEEYDLY